MIISLLPEIGQVFGDRTIIDIAEKYDISNIRLVLCKCKCDREHWVRYPNLLKGMSIQCRFCVRLKIKSFPMVSIKKKH